MCFKDALGGHAVETEFGGRCCSGRVLGCRDEPPESWARCHALAADLKALEPDTAQSTDAPAQCGLRADQDALGVGRLDDEHDPLVKQAVGELFATGVGLLVHASMLALRLLGCERIRGWHSIVVSPPAGVA
jgi:hypothetical protein